MPSSQELQTLLETILESRNVYFQPPEMVRINYPAIIFSLEGIDNSTANNAVYKTQRKYAVTVIHEDPDNEVIDKLNQIPTCRFNRHFTSDNLNHYNFSMIY